MEYLMRQSSFRLDKINEMDNILKTFVRQKLTPSTEYKRTGNEHADKIFKYLQQFNEFKIGRTLIGGSMGKNTALGDEFNPDYDLVVFLNHECPPFKGFLNFFDKKFQAEGKKAFGQDFVFGRATEFGLQFEIGIYKFDLLPAVNFEVGSGKKQIFHTLRAIEACRKPSSKKSGGVFSSSLQEYAVSFVLGFPEFVHDVIRLAKYWNKQVPISKDVYIPGRSTMIELIAIHANVRKKKKHLLTGFKRFLVAMTTVDSIEIWFGAFYSECAIAGTKMKSGMPLVMDPANPHNNISHELGKETTEMREALNAFMNKAQETLGNLDKLAIGWTVEQCCQRTPLPALGRLSIH